MLPEALTPGIVMDALANLPKARNSGVRDNVQFQVSPTHVDRLNSPQEVDSHGSSPVSSSQCVGLAAALLPLSVCAQEVRVGAPAPGFTATDSHGRRNRSPSTAANM